MRRLKAKDCKDREVLLGCDPTSIAAASSSSAAVASCRCQCCFGAVEDRFVLKYIGNTGDDDITYNQTSALKQYRILK